MESSGWLYRLQRKIEQWETQTSELWQAVTEVGSDIVQFAQGVEGRFQSVEGTIWNNMKSQLALLQALDQRVNQLPSDVQDLIKPWVEYRVAQIVGDEREYTQQELAGLSIALAALRSYTDENLGIVWRFSQDADQALQKQLWGQEISIEQVRAEVEENRRRAEAQESWITRIRKFFDDPWGFLLGEFIKWLTGNLDQVFSTIEDALWGEA